MADLTKIETSKEKPLKHSSFIRTVLCRLDFHSGRTSIPSTLLTMEGNGLI